MVLHNCSFKKGSEETMPKLAVYAGTFDPVTNGHLWMIEQGARLFDELIIAIGVNPKKHCMFSIEDRISMLEESVKHLLNVRVDCYTDRFLVKYADSVNAKFILRGIRNESDYASERTTRNINSDINFGIVTVFLMSPRETAEVSSSMVKGLIGFEGWENIVKNYVSDTVLQKLVSSCS